MMYSKKPLIGKSLGDLDFLVGYWKGASGEDVFEEFWFPEMHANMAGTFRWIKNGKVHLYEIFTIIEQEDEIHLLLRHFDKEFTALEEKGTPEDCVMTELSKNSVVFKTVTGDFLRYVIDNEVNLEFYFHGADGSVKFSLVFTKVE